MSHAGTEGFSRIERLPIATVAAVNGHAIGDGISLALSCDMRIASEAATVWLPELRDEFIPGWGTIERLIGAVGRAVATEMSLSGRRVSAAECRALG